MPSAPTAPFTKRADRIGGEQGHLLFQLTVSKPVSKTFYLAETSLNADALYTGSVAYQGIIETIDGVTMEAAGEGGGVTLTLLNMPGTKFGGGANRRFADWFAEPVAGFNEPYDLHSASLVVKIAWKGESAADELTVARYTLAPGGIQLTLDRLVLQFEDDRTLEKILPIDKIDTSRYPNASTLAIGKAVPYPFGQRRTIPGLLVDVATGKYLFAESPSATPVSAVQRLLIQVQDPDRETPSYEHLASPTNPTVAFTPADANSGLVNLTGKLQAQSFLLPTTQLISKVRLKLRAALVPTGRITIRLERDADPGFPSGELVDPVASADFDATSITSAEAIYDIPFLTPPIIQGRQKVWIVIGHANVTAGGSNTVQIRLSTGNASGVAGTHYYADGDYARKETTDAQWTKDRILQHLMPEHDAAQFNLDPCLPFQLSGGLEGPRVFSWLSLNGSAGRFLPVGPGFRCNRPVIARAWMRWNIAAMPANPTAVRLSVFYLLKNNPAASLQVFEVLDYGTLDADDIEGPTIGNPVTLLTPIDAANLLYSIDVTDKYVTAKARGATKFALRFQTESQDLSSFEDQWYGIAASESQNGIRSSLVFNSEATVSRFDLWFEVHAVTFTPQASADDGTGVFRALVDFAKNLGENRVLAAELDGLKDDGSGTYTGTANALIVKGSDIALWLARSSRALALDASRVDTAGFTEARTRLADWFDLAGVVDEAEPSRVWLTRLGQCCRSFFLIDQDGKLAVYSEGRAASVTRRIRVHEYADLQVTALADAAMTLPWSRVHVYYARDLLALPNPTGSLSTAPEWDGFALISKDQTAPIDKDREAEASDLEGRYGVRANGDPAGVPSEENTFFFVPEDRFDAIPAKQLLDWLWDRNRELTRSPFAVVTVGLPRFATGLRLMDELRLESYEFPWRGARAQPGELRLNTGQLAFGQLYGARRGVFSVRGLRTAVASGPRFPVSATLKLIGWEMT